MDKVDVIITGAGIMGSSLAMHLAEAGKKVLCLDVDLEGQFSSSELNAGGVRATWSQPLNIQICKHSIEFFETHAADVGYRACGYLWMHRPETFENAGRQAALQRSHGWAVETWDVARIRARIPFIDKTDDLAGAYFSPRDGLINSNALKQLMRTRARQAGAVFVDACIVESADPQKKSLKCFVGEKPFSEAEKKAYYQNGQIPGSAKAQTFQADLFVNCAGPWARQIAKVLGYQSPAKAVRRQVSVFDTREVDLTAYGMIVDPSGVYFHPEAGNGLAGFAVSDEPEGSNFEYDGEKFFQEYIWANLYERSTAFEKLRHLGGWAGLYEVSPDHSAIIGETPIRGIFEAHSFSGHGVMQAYSVGLALAEKMTTGSYRTLDLEPLTGSRFESGKILNEGALI